MKKCIAVLMIVGFSTSLLSAQDSRRLDFSLMGGATTYAGEVSGLGEARLSLSLSPWMDIFVGAAGVHHMERSTEGDLGDYHTEIGWSYLGFRPYLTLGNRVELGLSLSSGMGLVQYRYNRELQEELTWTEEYLDRVDVAVTTLAADMVVLLPRGWEAGIEGGWRFSSPLETPYGEKGDLSSWFGGLRINRKL